MAKQKPLKFKVAPHIVEDFGLNLYSSLPRVLVEFIANAYDADSPFAKITIDREKIQDQRTIIRAEWKVKQLHTSGKGIPAPRLAELTLPDDLTITIEDAGHGMSRKDLDEKFLVAGRRRRGIDNSIKRSTGGRILMGRKGLGKLAGFGVAKNVTLITRAKGESHATQIRLFYDDLIKVKNTHEIPVDEKRLKDGGGIKSHGTFSIKRSPSCVTWRFLAPF